ncbi:MAG: tyrosine-type recombinase/integrase [Lachnospiraceae bacterium]|nr:tyrosine-type recombinase/integrase [Lachnospiraceae bacterium]
MGKNLKGRELGKGITQRKDGRYTARFTTVRGKRVSKYFFNLQDARQWLAEARDLDANGGNQFSSAYTTVNEWYEYWMENIKEKTVRPNTFRNYKDRYLLNVKPYIGKMFLQDVKPMHCQKILNNMESKYAGSTIYQTYICLNNMFNAALDNDLITKSPMTRTVKLPKPIIKKNKVLTLEEQEKFLKEAKGTTNYRQYFFILNTGTRTGEMVGLKWEDLDFDRNIINIRRTMEYNYKKGEWLIGPPKTKTSCREIPMTKANREMLLKMKEEVEKGRFVKAEFKDFVFINKNGTPTKNSTYDNHLIKITNKAEIQNISMHTLRHTFATRCAEAGMKPKALQNILGHANINITMNVYVHLTDEEKTKEMEKFEIYSDARTSANPDPDSDNTDN